MPVVTRPLPVGTRATTTPTTERSTYFGSLLVELRDLCCGLALVAVPLGCAGPVSKSPVTPAPVAPVYRGPLSDYVSSAGLRWLVLLRPALIASDSELGPALRQVVPDARLDAFSEASG